MAVPYAIHRYGWSASETGYLFIAIGFITLGLLQSLQYAYKQGWTTPVAMFQNGLLITFAGADMKLNAAPLNPLPWFGGFSCLFVAACNIMSSTAEQIVFSIGALLVIGASSPLWFTPANSLVGVATCVDEPRPGHNH